MAGETEERGFKIVDRRREGRDEDEAAEVKSEEMPAQQEQEPVADSIGTSEEGSGERPDPAKGPSGGAQAAFDSDQGFAQFLLSLATSVYMHLGLVPAPDGEKVEKNLPLAKQSIDILGMLATKTQGNRTKEEDALMTQILSELRMRYVEATKTS